MISGKRITAAKLSRWGKPRLSVTAAKLSKLQQQRITSLFYPRSKKKSLLAYSDAPKLRLKKTPKGLPLASIEPHATSAVEVPSKESVDQEVEKAGEKTKFFEKHKTKRKVLQDTRLSKKLLNSSKGVALHVARMKSAREATIPLEDHVQGDEFSVSTL